MASGWIGDAEQIEHYLSVIGADRDASGKFIIYHEKDRPPVSFLGMGQEIVLRGTEEYSVKGHRANLAAGLHSTSYGVRITVI